ncbi:MAG: PH domain-containing protein, partial [Proteobacteria bacterium]|nr:PH domain-containing protein [Pseudomonadota bacterium]
MSYIRDNLLKNEKLVYANQIHWIIFAMPVALLAVSLIFSIFGPLIIPGGIIPIINIPLDSIISLAFLLAAIISGAATLMRYATSEYGITDKRIILKTGFIRINSLELFIDKIEAVYIDQTIFGRIFDYG